MIMKTKKRRHDKCCPSPDLSRSSVSAKLKVSFHSFECSRDEDDILRKFWLRRKYTPAITK